MDQPLSDTGPGGLLASYHVMPGWRDEMVGPDGSVDSGWQALIGALDRLGPDALSARFARADNYLRDAGVFYRVYDGQAASDREWPLSPIPVVISESEWDVITAGLRQRVDLLERVMADCYGPGSLVADGTLPADLIAGSPEFLRPLAGLQPAGGHFLHFCAFDLGRGPDGRWWVLGDRTQAPSGAGFALENRVATIRAMPDIYAQMNVHRLAGFFSRFRDALQQLAERQGGRAGILTPGPHNDTYFEHAYIARYLGFMLLEGEDLTVENGQVLVRTVSGLKPISVLWRRLDASFADPLELRSDSHIGTAGMIEGLRNQRLTMVNALGSGLLEAKALLAFMPALGERLLGEELKLPSIATWWCGQQKERDYVLDHLDDLAVAGAFSTLPIGNGVDTRLVASLDDAARAALIDDLTADGRRFVAQERVTLSTAPVYLDGRLVPRPVSLRVFAARTADGWQILPGGFARVGASLDPEAMAMQRGGQTADVWVLGARPVEKVTLLGRPTDRLARNEAGRLPSRAADNLIWMGRYIERAESQVRILRAYHGRLAENAGQAMPLLDYMADFLDRLDVDVSKPIPTGLSQTIDGAMYSAGHIRDRFSPDGWLALRDLSKTVHQFAQRVTMGDDSAHAMTVLLRKLAGFSGLVHENMYRFVGWRFLEIGRRLERGMEMARLAAWMVQPDAPDGALDMLIEIGDSVMTHRRRYSIDARPETVVDLMVLDGLNPRAVQFQLDALNDQLKRLPGGVTDGHLNAPARLALKLQTQLRVADAVALDADALDALALELGNLAELVQSAYFT